MDLPNPEDDSREDDTLALGLDLGTTFSGVSHGLWRGSLRNGPRTIVTWPNYHEEAPKTPTQISYRTANEFCWGIQEAGTKNVISWFKLLLMNSEDLEPAIRYCEHIFNALMAMQESNKMASELVGDYLKGLLAHAYSCIRRETGDNYVDTKPIHLIFTVPAIWKESAIQRMKDAIEHSGALGPRPNGIPATTYKFITEPEAAALAAFQVFIGWDTLKPGMTFVVADIGGGTVDCISYIVNEGDSFQLQEVVEGDGALCGSTFLDSAFRESVKQKILDQWGLTWNDVDPDDQERVFQWWEKHKRIFDGSEWHPEAIKLVKKDGERIQVNYTPKEIGDLFDTVKPRIEELVEHQVNEVHRKTLRNPNFIVLVGGFGKSPYLYESLKRKYLGRITILREQGDGPWSSVSRGAVMFGMGSQVVVKSRVARYSYGYAVHHLYEDRVHDPRDKVWDLERGCFMAKDQMVWIIKRGDDIATCESNTLPYEIRYHHRERGCKEISANIWKSERADPPNRLPDLEADDKSKTMTGIRITTPAVETLPQITEHGVTSYVFEYDLTMEVLGASVHFSATWVGDRSREITQKKNLTVILGGDS
ncbi:hypothetical protein F5Y04DRAFT_288292 [Hypomontagnella monticulosa]|nr:hypothetical protein F5Y04DRAFT_288292 [Hypomontagnella monticulosa]